jgi:hypothetical protein
VEIVGTNRASADLIDWFALNDRTGFETGLVPHQTRLCWARSRYCHYDGRAPTHERGQSSYFWAWADSV